MTRRAAAWVGFSLVSSVALAAPTPAAPETLVVAARSEGPVTAYTGVVEAVRQTVLAAQVPGAVVQLAVKAGDRVRAGQVLLRLDARSAEQQAGAAAAQVGAARAAQEAATKEFERQKQLFQKQYISQAALERAESQFKQAQAQAQAQLAAAGAARSETDHFTLKAPYDGVVADVAVVQGDMALPGRPLLTVYDPAVLRVTAAVPQTAAPRTEAPLQLEIPGLNSARLSPSRWQLLPAVDAATHTQTLRLELPAGTAATPGQFARVWLPGAVQGAPRLAIPTQAVLRRAELTAVYVLGAEGRPLLRQVRLGPVSGDWVEVLSGLSAGERVVLKPQAVSLGAKGR
ncbi:efflux RND transporter periplasmic adaptor subunit [Inhella gelatinilytica]|uniref:Efflux RND transporter periplasmic adaptor subunit n=1 Tax=Inhella gelatinilytica TaxID=2795030 RepID=A0A931NCT2_9BURK|nr:efflux RND transporter periplasmic adaptor subunit [Inhella gelatinilytica]MBH9551869.1 efflux RND transporter periplasmic adaptor subunit [Inhella gelatinilytica]